MEVRRWKLGGEAQASTREGDLNRTRVFIYHGNRADTSSGLVSDESTFSAPDCEICQAG